MLHVNHIRVRHITIVWEKANEIHVLLKGSLFLYKWWLAKLGQATYGQQGGRIKLCMDMAGRTRYKLGKMYACSNRGSDIFQ